MKLKSKNLEIIQKYKIKKQKDKLQISSEFALREIHFGVGLHKLFHFSSFFEFIGCGETLLFLPHIKHHFFDGGSGLSIKVRQFGWFRVDFLGVDLLITFDGSTPPRGLVFPFFDVDMNVLSFVVIELSVFNSPVGFLGVDFIFPFAVDECLALDGHFKLINGKVNFGGFLYNIWVHKNEHLKILKFILNLPPKFGSKCICRFCHRFLWEQVHCLILWFRIFVKGCLWFLILELIILWLVFVVQLFVFLRLTFLIFVFSFFRLLLYVFVREVRLVFFRR